MAAVGPRRVPEIPERPQLESTLLLVERAQERDARGTRRIGLNRAEGREDGWDQGERAGRMEIVGDRGIGFPWPSGAGSRGIRGPVLLGYAPALGVQDPEEATDIYKRKKDQIDAVKEGKIKMYDVKPKKR